MPHPLLFLPLLSLAATGASPTDRDLRVVADVPLPFVREVTMFDGWAKWLASNSPRCTIDIEYNREPFHWQYDKHGWMPWMQFFYDWRFGDIQNDGRLGFIQTNGARQQIAYDFEGNELWRYEDPEADFRDIRYDSFFPIYDFDGDGRQELICARKRDGELMLALVDTATGEAKKLAPFPGEGDHCTVKVVFTGKDPGKPEIAINWNVRDLHVLDHDLNLRWSVHNRDLPEREHTPIAHSFDAADVDGDGRDEILAGSVLFDSDGEVLWVAPDLPALVKDGHADSVHLTPDPDTGDWRMLMSTGAYVFDQDGELLWGDDSLKHGQKAHPARIRTDVPGPQFVVYEGVSRVDKSLPDKVVAFDWQGDRLWEREIVQPDMQEGGFGFWLGDWNGDGLDEVFVNDRDVCRVLDGRGEQIAELPGYLIYVFDLAGDERVEAVTLTDIAPDMRMRIFANAAENPNPETSDVPERRTAPMDMVNMSRY
ncbi:MAG: hypothetical protein ACLFV3_00075 [Phycisphaeraceae bacterium]